MFQQIPEGDARLRIDRSLETRQGIQPDGTAFKRAKSAFSKDRIAIIEEFNATLIAS